MATAVSIFGVAAPGKDAATFCYAQFRTVPDLLPFPRLALPAATKSEMTRIIPDIGGLELQVWETVLGDEEAAQLAAELERGALRLPDRCPIEPGQTLNGVVFAETLLVERGGRLEVEGRGVLRTRGFALVNGAGRVAAALQQVLGRKEIGEELNALLALLNREAGLQRFDASRLGVVEFLSRWSSDVGLPPVAAGIVKPHIHSQDPCREIFVRRSAGATATDLRVSLLAKSGTAVVLQRLIFMAAGDNEIRIDAGCHVTSLLVGVFDASSGEMIDQEQLSFTQSIGISLRGQEGVDLLPPPFRSAPASGDLVERPRVNTAAFSIAGGGRSGGFDVMRDNAEAIASLAGRDGAKLESRFFPPGQEPQLEVIRWIKEKIEGSDVTEAFLVDPFLGTEALKRVVLRHGNESVKLTIVVSPANVDPDAADMDATGVAGRHIANLVKEADALASQLCGAIEIIHVQRGSGTRQAFHDRYLGLVGRDGTPRVFLLSNSLSKAAGDWPFTVAEVDTPTAWRIAAYIAAVAEGKDEGGKDLKATTIWRSRDAKAEASPASVQPDALSSALGTTYSALFAENNRQGIEDRGVTDPILDRLVAALPSEFDVDRLASVLIEGMHGRDHLVPPIIHRFSDNTDLKPVADRMQDQLLERLLERLSPTYGLFGTPEELVLLRLGGERISRREKGTDMVRNRMNPALDSYARALEIGRVHDQIPRLIAGLGLVLIGLYLVRADGGIPTKFRAGIAVDYVRLLGRLLRSMMGRRYLGGPASTFKPYGWELAREAVRLSRELATDPVLDLEPVINAVLSDPLMPTEVLA